MTGLDIAVLHAATENRPDERDTLRAVETVRAALRRLGHRPRVARLHDETGAPKALAASRPDLVFNLVEAIEGDGARAGAVPGLLAEAGLRFTGCGAAAERFCASKPAMKRRMLAMDLPTPPWCETGATLGEAARVIVKAQAEHASYGLDAESVVPGARAAAEIAARAARFGAAFLAEIYVPGREFNLAMLDGVVLPPAEILFEDFPAARPRIVDYEAKWLPDGFAYAHTPRRFGFPDADGALLDALCALARRAWEAFSLEGYARIDFRVDAQGAPWLLEVNTNPCLSGDAGFAAAAARAGLSYERMIAAVVAAAMEPRQAAA